MTTRTCFVSGSGQNIGRAIAVALAEKGHNVVINGASNRKACDETAELCRAHGVETLVAMGNVGDRDAAAAIAEAALAKFGTVDMAVNNAAIRPTKAFLEIAEEEWKRVIETNLYSVFYLSRAFLPGMIARKWGRIINFAGMNAMHGYGGGGSQISASKHAVWGMTKALAKEFGPQGVTVNIVSPGPIRRTDGRAGGHAGGDAIKGIPLARTGEPSEVAALVAFLCSDEAGFVTAQMIACNGGGQT
ncbi:MAG: SDR family oxidoreductase [Rhizobiales bacterium]|nr:SDR family oxidoreductase [Hyphomicrobiales bacterium]